MAQSRDMSITGNLPQSRDDAKSEIVIVGQRARGAVVTDADPTVVIDARAIRAIGATNLAELLKAVAAGSTWGGANEPITLLNGRRVAGFSAIAGLPPEAIERIDVLPPATARQFGFAADRNVINFVTFKHFRSRQADILEGTSTDGGSANLRGTAGITRIDGDQQLAVTLEIRKRDALRQSRRHLTATPRDVYSLAGTIARFDGTEIDPRLSQLAGFPVTSVSVPSAGENPRLLTSYVVSANRVSPTDLGRYRDIDPASRYIGLNSTWSTPISGKITSSFNLSLDQQQTSALQGPATSILSLDRDSPMNPFDNDITIYRYLADLPPLQQSSNSFNVHASAELGGYLGDTGWSLTLAGDRSHQTTFSEFGIDNSILQSRIDRGLPPFTLLSTDYIGDRQSLRSRSTSNVATASFVANSPLAKLPSGSLSSTLVMNYSFLGWDTASSGSIKNHQARNTLDASISIDLPLSGDQGRIVPAVGQLSVNLTGGVAYVPIYGLGLTGGYGATWNPIKKLQFIISVIEVRSPPSLQQVGSPLITSNNVPFFDTRTGVSTVITTFTGGNRLLAPERRRTSYISANLRPFDAKDFHISIVYSSIDRNNQTLGLDGLTDALEANFPGRFIRDASGNLVSADLSPINVSFEKQNFISSELYYSGKIGRSTPGLDVSKAVDTRPNLLLSFTPMIRVYDRSRLRDSSNQIDLLSSGSFSGLGGRSRFELTSLIGLTFGGGGGNLTIRNRSSTRSSSVYPESSLSFRSLTTISAEAFAFINTSAASANRVTITLKVDNILNHRQVVLDGLGDTPERFQPAYLDPIGRTMSLTLRKVF